MKTTTYTDRDEWLAARKGKITGSRLADIIVKNDCPVVTVEALSER